MEVYAFPSTVMFAYRIDSTTLADKDYQLIPEPEGDISKDPGNIMSHPIYKNINRAIIYAPGSSHAYIQQNHQDITTRISNKSV
jgi:hypothetical protein